MMRIAGIKTRHCWHFEDTPLQQVGDTPCRVVQGKGGSIDLRWAESIIQPANREQRGTVFPDRFKKK
jgi:hypothetical protein